MVVLLLVLNIGFRFTDPDVGKIKKLLRLY